MSGLGDRFAEGDRVAQVRRIAPGIDKRREGVVRKVGSRGVQIRFDDGEDLWQPAHGVELVEAGRRHRAPRLAVVDVVPELVEATPVPEAPQAPPDANDVLARLEASGADLVALWRALGAGLTERKRRAVTEADDAVTRAEADVRDAEGLLADARRTLAAAKARAQDARTELAQVEREMGVLR